MSIRQWKAAVVQSEPVWFDKEATLEKTKNFILEAAANGAALIAFPEVWIPGYPNFVWTGNFNENQPLVQKYMKNSITAYGPEIVSLRKMAKANNIFVGIGFSERENSSLYLAQMLISNEGEVLLHRRKLKPTHVERTIYGEATGDSLINVVETKLGRIGMLNCWEHLQPLLKFNTYAQGEQVHIACWPYDSGLAWSQLASKMHALEGGTFVLSTNQITTEDGFKLNTEGQTSPLGNYQNGIGGGRSVIYGPNGLPLTEPTNELFDGLIYANIDLDSIINPKMTADPIGHYSRPDLMRLLIDDRPKSTVFKVSEEATSLHQKPIPLTNTHKTFAEIIASESL
ncbi:unnamed protein product [Kuraishia capsulata CBS 1993]|uniref:CN hydrolase domain-containing protein n=1 Tax=Kuraishia capsulata CBS 1993 TaxID=1382522 RepID=W6MWB5_9ASCO|nr:uncharacterized protein KUCA_T00003132001 [Kuraishia capsulata CBS 1993]CDK27155.1 unnamed protein product [Kuraishia capsulata CBS 1993]